MLNKQKLIRLAMIIGAALILQACFATAALVTTGAVTAKVVGDSRTISGQKSDVDLSALVSKTIKENAQLKKEARIEVIAYQGDIVLIGQAPNQGIIDLATNVVKSVPEVKNIYNEIRINAKISALQASSDTIITSKIKSKFLAEKDFKANAVKVITENNEVFLFGSLSKKNEATAITIARNTSGVTRVIKILNTID